jgi:hypothetical protein
MNDQTEKNMVIWSPNEKTDPKFTTVVNQRGGFTSVSAQYQVMKATMQFGPLGVGWGYEAKKEIHGDVVMQDVILWHGNRQNTFGPVTGCAQFFNVGKNKTTDTDAPKKATTDALTKLLSQLGFSADIFLGLYDDNKYIAKITQEFSEAQFDIDGVEKMAKSFIGNTESVKKLDDGIAKSKENLNRIKQLSPERYDALQKLIQTKRDTLLILEDTENGR